MLTPDRGSRVEQKILHLLANVQADGIQPLAEVVAASLPQFRRGMTVCIVTGATTRDWVRPLASLARRGWGRSSSSSTSTRSRPARMTDWVRARSWPRSAMRWRYAIANVVMHADAPERVLVTKERVRA